MKIELSGGSGGDDDDLLLIADEFNATSYGNNDGAQDWSGDWVEISESDGPTSNDVKVISSEK